jgi:hypothetical protein
MNLVALVTKQTEPRKIPHHAVVPLNGNKYGLVQNYRVIPPDFHLAKRIPKNLTRFYKRGVLGRAAHPTQTIEKINFQPKY